MDVDSKRKRIALSMRLNDDVRDQQKSSTAANSGKGDEQSRRRQSGQRVKKPAVSQAPQNGSMADAFARARKTG